MAQMSQDQSSGSLPSAEIEACVPSYRLTCKPPWLSKRNTYTDVVNFDEIVKFKRHAAHVLLWSHGRDTDLVLGEFLLKYRVLMQVRFDGAFGFPGGIIDEVKDHQLTTTSEFFEAIKAGLKREVNEEMMMKVDFDPKYVYTSISSSDEPKKVMCHAYVAEIPIETMELIETNFSRVLTSDEVLGITRVPMYILPENYKARGLPTFLASRFAGNGLEQLLRGCLSEQLLTEREVQLGLSLAADIIANP